MELQADIEVAEPVTHAQHPIKSAIHVDIFGITVTAVTDAAFREEDPAQPAAHYDKAVLVSAELDLGAIFDKRLAPGSVGTLVILVTPPVFHTLAELRVVVVQDDAQTRSEEHTSELQSRENLVCRLL